MYKATAPTVYAVHWPAINTFKIGYSDRQRWRTFLLRGAELLSLLSDFESFSHALDFECACHIACSRVCRPAFSNNVEAIPYLGNGGGGYLECYRVPADLMASEVLEFVDLQLEELHAQA